MDREIDENVLCTLEQLGICRESLALLTCSLFLRPTLMAVTLKSYAFEQAEGHISQQQSYNTDPAAHGENNLHSYFPIY